MAVGQTAAQICGPNSDSEKSPLEFIDMEEDGSFTFSTKKSRTVKPTLIPTANRFKVLSEIKEVTQDNAEENSRTKEKIFFPPIVLHTESVKKRLNRDEKTTQRKIHCRIHPRRHYSETSTKDDFDKIINTVKARNIGYYTFDSDTRKFAGYVGPTKRTST